MRHGRVWKCGRAGCRGHRAIVYLPQPDSSWQPATTLLAGPPPTRTADRHTYVDQARIASVETLHHHPESHSLHIWFLSSIINFTPATNDLDFRRPLPLSSASVPITPDIKLHNLSLKPPRRAKQTRKWYPRPRSTCPTKANYRGSRRRKDTSRRPSATATPSATPPSAAETPPRRPSRAPCDRLRRTRRLSSSISTIARVGLRRKGHRRERLPRRPPAHRQSALRLSVHRPSTRLP